MTDQSPPTLPYETPKPRTHNLATRAARLSWLSPLVTVLGSIIVITFFYQRIAGSNVGLIAAIGIIFLLPIIGLVSAVVALATMRRYGPVGIRRPAIIGLCASLILLLLLAAAAVTLALALTGHNVFN